MATSTCKLISDKKTCKASHRYPGDVPIERKQKERGDLAVRERWDCYELSALGERDNSGWHIPSCFATGWEVVGGEIFMSWARVYLCLMFLEVGVRNETLSSAMVGSLNFMQVNTSLISFFVRELSLRNKKRRLWFDGSWRKHEEESVVCPVHLRSTARKVRRSLRSWSLLAWIELFCAYGRGWGWGMD